jgi:small GTP-binding protein
VAGHFMDWERARGLPDVKVILVGDVSVGKTSIVTQFNTATFDENVDPTVGAVFVAKQVDTSRGTVNLLVWDTAGQERYRSLVPMYSRTAAAAVLVVDVTSMSSFESVGEWYKMLKDTCPPKVKIYVVANKIDLECAIPILDLEQWANNNEMPFFRSCANEFKSVAPIFKRIAEDFRHLGAAPKMALVSRKVPEDDECC